MRYRRPALALLLAALLTLLLLPAGAAAQAEGDSLTILFTHDTHDHWLPVPNPEGSGTYGGYSRLATVLDEQRKQAEDPVVTLDGGDFAMGSLFQSIYSTHALELRVLGAMGFDATTFGNHEYDYRPQGWQDMLHAAVASGEALPAIVEANYPPPEEDAASWAAWNEYGVEPYTVIEREGLRIAVFGLMGLDAHESAPMSGMVFLDPIETARQVVAEIQQKEDPDFIICLSHSGTEGGKGEDYELAKAVDGIDVIISGHTHTTLHEPILVNGTYIASCGEYTKYLGKLTITKTDAGLTLNEYALIPVNDAVAADPAIAAMTEQFRQVVSDTFLSRYGLEFDTVLNTAPFAFESQDAVYTQHDSALASLITDAYRKIAEEATGRPVDMAATAAGVIRETLPKGDITVADVFNMASLGIGADQLAGYPLVSVYLTGKDLKTVLEIDASVAPIMGAAHLYFSGVEYGYNTRRMLFNRLTEAHMVADDGSLTDIADDQLYHVVTGLYCGQMLGTVEATSFGLLSVTPRDKDGVPIDMENLDAYIIHDSAGNEVKEWYAIADYLRSLGDYIDYYEQPDGRKTVYASWNPIELLKSPNKFTIIAMAAGLVVIALVTLAVILIRRRVAKSQRTRRLNRPRHQAGAKGYRAYRGK